MRRPGVLWEAYVTRFLDVFERFKQHRLTAEEAGELLNLSARHFRRQCRRFEEEGEDGLRDRRLGRVSNRRAPESELDRMRRLYREEYADFTVKHFHEDLRRRHNYTLGYTTTRLALQASGEVKPAPGRGRHRKKRTRRPLPGMMLFQDGSTHRWIAALGHDIDLIVTMDDATSHIYSAFFVPQEGTMSSFTGLAETITAHGARPVRFVLHGPWLALFPHAEGGGQGGPEAPDPSRESVEPVGDPPCSLLLSRGARADGTGVRDVAAAPGAGTAPGRGADDGGGERVSTDGVCSRAQREVRQAGRGTGQRVCRLCRDRAGGSAVRARGSAGRARQLRVLCRAITADTGADPSPPLREGHGAGARLSQRTTRNLRWPRCLARYNADGAML